ncbi:MAG: ABC transporter permease [Verrucomicrobia bacterium]|nr:ABC transporter permease [Verrucomicrobiota bacterium]
MFPVAERELLVAARSPKTFFWRLIAALVVCVIALVAFWAADRFGTRFVDGRQVFTFLTHLAFVCCLFGGASLTSDSISSERREGTLGLLFLTQLRGHDIVLGKLLAASLRAAYSLLGTLPIMAISLLIGGVSVLEFVRVALHLMVTLYLSLSIGLYVSTRHTRQRFVANASSLAVLTLAAGLFGAGWIFSDVLGSTTADRLLQLPSPISPHLTAFDPLYQRTTLWGLPLFWLALSAQVALASQLLLRTSIVLRTLLHSTSPRRTGNAPASATIPPPLHPQSASHRLHRNRTSRTRDLDQNPFAWLASRGNTTNRAAFAVIAGVFVYTVWKGNQRADPVVTAGVATLFTLMSIKLLAASQMCGRLTEDRLSGALELLLTTPLGGTTIVRGQWQALWRQMRPPMVGLVVFLGYLHWLIQTNEQSALHGFVHWLFWVQGILFFPECLALGWVSLWMTQRCRTAAHATATALALVVLLPFALSVWIAATFNLVSFQATAQTNDSLFGATWLGLSLLNCLFWGTLGARAVRRDLQTAPTSGALHPVRTRPGAPGVPVQNQKTQRQSSLVTTRQVLLVITALGVLVFIWHRFHQDRLVAACMQHLRTSGSPVTLTELDTWYTQVPNEKNAAFMINEAIDLFVPPAAISRQLARLVREPGDLLQNRQYQALSPLLNLYLQTNQPSVSRIKTIDPMLPARYPVNFRAGLQTQLPHLAGIMALANFLHCESRIHLANHRAADALESFQALLTLAQSLAPEPCLVSQLNRMLLLNGCLPLLEELLTRAELPEKDLRILQDRLTRCETASRPALQRALAGERCMGLDLFFRKPAHVVPLLNPTASSTEQFLWGSVLELRALTGLADRETANYLRILGDLIHAETAPYPEAYARSMQIALELRDQRAGWMGLVSQSTLPKLESAAGRTAHHALRLRLMRLAVAVERYRLANGGALPRELRELMPDFLAEVPKNPFDTTALSLIPLAPGYDLAGNAPDRTHEHDPEKKRLDPPPIRFRIGR